MAELGAVKKIGFDDEGYERRERLEAIGECPRCGKEVELWSDTEEWKKGKDGRRHHLMYGPAMGQCCELLFVDSFDGAECYDLSKREGEA